jgi:hypothetical protein
MVCLNEETSMHYKNGRLAKVGDMILVQPQYGTPFVGVLVAAQEGSTSCNGTVTPIDPQKTWSVTLGECIHVDDVTAAPGPQASTDGT